jgi:hypothetical protein
MLPPEPIVITYMVDPTQPPPERPQAWDIEVSLRETVPYLFYWSDETFALS